MDDQTRRVSQLENEIAETRVELSETIGAIEERLAPSNIAAEAKERIRTTTAEKLRANALPLSAVAVGAAAAWIAAKVR